MRCGAFAVTLSAIFASVVLVRSHYRHLRAVETVKEIEAALGEVQFRDSAWERLLAYFDGWSGVRDDTIVLLQSNIDDEWLESHDNLSALDIGILNLNYPQISGRQTAKLIQCHSLKECNVAAAQEADLIAEALANQSQVRSVSLSDSDLTDSGLRQLPLEQLRRLEIDGTSVTSAGIAELKRCRQLEHLGVDNRQLGSAYDDLLKRFPNLDVYVADYHPPRQ